MEKIIEDTDLYMVVIELPGVQRQDLNVELNGDILTVALTPSPSEEHPERTLLWSEFDIKPLTLRYRLPRGLNREALSATLADGVLTLEIPKVEPLKKRITIKTNSNSAA
jgi:HSP20 family protein